MVAVLYFFEKREKKGSEANMANCEHLFNRGDYRYRDICYIVFFFSLHYSVTKNFKRR